MNRSIEKFTAILLIAGLIFIPVVGAQSQYGSSEKPGPAQMAFDILALRPLGFLATTLGSAIFLVSLPLTAALDSTGTVYTELVEKPATYTFKRPIGDY